MKKKLVRDLIYVGLEVAFPILTKEEAKQFVMAMDGPLRVKKILISRINHEHYRGKHGIGLLVRVPESAQSNIHALPSLIKRTKELVSPSYIEKISYLKHTGTRFLLRDVAIQKRPIKTEDKAHIVTSIGLFGKPKINEVAVGKLNKNPYFLFVRPLGKIKVDEINQKPNKNEESLISDKQVINHELAKHKKRNHVPVRVQHTVGV